MPYISCKTTARKLLDCEISKSCDVIAVECTVQQWQCTQNGRWWGPSKNCHGVFICFRVWRCRYCLYRECGAHERAQILLWVVCLNLWKDCSIRGNINELVVSLRVVDWKWKRGIFYVLETLHKTWMFLIIFQIQAHLSNELDRFRGTTFPRWFAYELFNKVTKRKCQRPFLTIGFQMQESFFTLDAVIKGLKGKLAVDIQKLDLSWREGAVFRGNGRKAFQGWSDNEFRESF